MNTDFVANPDAHTLPTAKEGDKVGLKILASVESLHTLVKGVVTKVGTKNINIEIYELCDWKSENRIVESKYSHYIGKTISIAPEYIHVIKG